METAPMSEFLGWIAFALLLLVHLVTRFLHKGRLAEMQERTRREREALAERERVFDEQRMTYYRNVDKRVKGFEEALTEEGKNAYETGLINGRKELERPLALATARAESAEKDAREYARQLTEPAQRVKALRLEAEEKTLREFLDKKKKDEEAAPPKRPFAGIDES